MGYYYPFKPVWKIKKLIFFIKNRTWKRKTYGRGVRYVPLVGSSDIVAGNRGGALPKATLRLGRVIAGLSGHRTGPFRALRTLVVVLTSASAEPVLGLTQALATAHAVEETQRNGIVKALPMLLGNEDPGKHGHSKATEKKSLNQLRVAIIIKTS